MNTVFLFLKLQDNLVAVSVDSIVAQVVLS